MTAKNNSASALQASEISPANLRAILMPHSTPLHVTLMGTTFLSDDKGTLTVTDANIVFEGIRNHLLLPLDSIRHLSCNGSTIVIHSDEKRFRFDIPPLSPNDHPVRKPIFSIIALALPLLYTAWGLSLDSSGFKGFGMGICLIFAFFVIVLPISLFIAAVSVLRRERFMILAAIEIFVYSFSIFWGINGFVK